MRTHELVVLTAVAGAALLQLLVVEPFVPTMFGSRPLDREIGSYGGPPWQERAVPTLWRDLTACTPLTVAVGAWGVIGVVVLVVTMRSGGQAAVAAVRLAMVAGILAVGAASRVYLEIADEPPRYWFEAELTAPLRSIFFAILRIGLLATALMIAVSLALRMVPLLSRRPA